MWPERSHNCRLYMGARLPTAAVGNLARHRAKVHTYSLHTSIFFRCFLYGCELRSLSNVCSIIDGNNNFEMATNHTNGVHMVLLGLPLGQKLFNTALAQYSIRPIFRFKESHLHDG